MFPECRVRGGCWPAFGRGVGVSDPPFDAITIAMEKLNVTRSITEAAGKLGYPIMKPEQLRNFSQI